MEARIEVFKLTHEDIVDVLSTGLAGSFSLGVDYEEKDYEKIPKEKRESIFSDSACLEDKCADILLNGMTITLADLYAEGTLYGNIEKKRIVEDEDDQWYDCGLYEISLADFLKGCSSEEGYKLLTDILSGDGDLCTGECLLQLIMFGKVIYG